MDYSGDIEVIIERGADVYGLTLKGRVNGLLYRVAPARDPHQPRFWCVIVYRCSPGGLADTSEIPWVDSGGHRREELPAVMQAIREDPAAWLGSVANRSLRDWMLDPGATPSPANPLITRVTARQPAA